MSSSCSERYTHPGDALLVRYSDQVVALLRQGLGLTPNMVTLLSILAALLALWMLHRRNLVGFVALAVLSYYFDGLDGNMARRYRIFSEYGEALDKFSDAAFFVGIVGVLAFSYGAWRKRPVLLALYALSGLIPAVQDAALSRACGSSGGVMDLLGTIFLLPRDPERAAKIASLMSPFGGASYQLFMIPAAVALAIACDPGTTLRRPKAPLHPPRPRLRTRR
jgi:hypothetical protein